MKEYLGRALWMTALAALSLGVLVAQDFVGTWQGSLKNAKGKEFRLVGKLSRATNEKLSVTFYSIDQGGQPLPGIVSQQGDGIKIDIPAMGGTYEGKLSADRNTLVGTWAQAQPVALNFMRATPETAWEIPAPPPPPRR